MKFLRVYLLIFLLSLFGCGEGESVIPAGDRIDQPTSSNTNSLSELDGNVSFPQDDGETRRTITGSNSRTQVASPEDRIDQIQSVLRRANSQYLGQGKFHQENGQIIAAEFPNCGLKDLSPLRGLQLQALDLSGNPVRELRHLRGMPLVRLYLEFTLVESLVELADAQLVELRLNGSPVQKLDGLEGQPLENLYAVGTQINDVKALSTSNLKQLWLTESPVSDLSPLSGLPLVSLTIHRTLVADLDFVRKLPLIQRLHIGETLISDLTPLRGLNLTRLVFTPDRIDKGIAVVKGLSNLKEIGTKFDDQGKDLMPTDAFWAQFQP
ncbi:MAG: hypothetical protein P8P49_13345 [Opitutales bacterium]|nr:hypothetical protein [Opitutales bacterium]